MSVVQRVVTERDAGATWQAIADHLNEDGVPTQRGGTTWRVSSVQRLYQSHGLDREAVDASRTTKSRQSKR